MYHVNYKCFLFLSHDRK